MTFVDLIKDFIDTSKERLKTPISGAFIWAFIIWNWRPIVLLLFSEQTIEDRIQIIDQYFCTLPALIWPIGLALFYTIAIPAIMIGIDWVLAPIKKIRIGRIYESKDYVTDEKIKLARKEFELKNIETGNKQIEDFQRQIQELEESKNVLIKNHQFEKDELNSNLSNTTEMYKNSARSSNNLITELKNKINLLEEDVAEKENELKNDDRVMTVLIKLTPEETYILRELALDRLENIGEKALLSAQKKFEELNLVNFEVNRTFIITNFGLQVVKRIGNFDFVLKNKDR